MSVKKHTHGQASGEKKGSKIRSKSFSSEESNLAVDSSKLGLLADVENNWKNLNLAENVDDNGRGANSKPTVKNKNVELKEEKWKQRAKSKLLKRQELLDKQKAALARQGITDTQIFETEQMAKHTDPPPVKTQVVQIRKAQTIVPDRQTKTSVLQLQRADPEKDKQVKEMIEAIEHPGHLLFGNEQIWYDYNEPCKGQDIAPKFVTLLHTKASQLLVKETSLYEQEQAKRRDFSGSHQFLQHGTLSDKLGMLSLLATDSPLHAQNHMEALLSACNSKHRESAVKAFEILKDTLVNHFLPDRHLVRFDKSKIASREWLTIWAYEDWLKGFYFQFLEKIEFLLTNSVENIRMRALQIVFDLFRAKPEQESNLLRFCINKLGDRSGKVVSLVKAQMLITLQQHSAMSHVVVAAVAEALDRSSEYRLRYYCIDMLSDFTLNRDDPVLANLLLQLYQHIYTRLIAEATAAEHEVAKPVKEDKKTKHQKPRAKVANVGKPTAEMTSRLLAKIFTGMGRAYPFCDMGPARFTECIDKMYATKRFYSTNTYVEALYFISLLAKDQQGNAFDRFMRGLYISLQDPSLSSSSKLSKYFKLLLDSLAQNRDNERAWAFAKRLVQTAHHWLEIGPVTTLIYITGKIKGVNKMLKSTAYAGVYDCHTDDPCKAHAGSSNLWELLPMLNHYHPTVAEYSRRLYMGENKTVDMPDLDALSSIAFLSKWSYDKPKEASNLENARTIVPLSGHSDTYQGRKRIPEVPLPSQDWASRTEGSIAPDEKFYFEYFKSRDASKVSKPKRKQKLYMVGEDADIPEAGEEHEIFDAIVKSSKTEPMSETSEILSEDEARDAQWEQMLRNALGDVESRKADTSGVSETVESMYEADDLVLKKELRNFADGNFDNVSLQESMEVGLSDKRKRNSRNYPVFMDMDEFESKFSKKLRSRA